MSAGVANLSRVPEREGRSRENVGGRSTKAQMEFEALMRVLDNLV